MRDDLMFIFFKLIVLFLCDISQNIEGTDPNIRVEASNFVKLVQKIQKGGM